MQSTSIESLNSEQVVEDGSILAGEQNADIQPRWYAAYTRSHHELQVAERLADRAVQNYLPRYEVVRKWKDRKVRLQRPLFPGYVFVHFALQNRLQVLQVPGVACLVSFAGRPVAVPDQEIERIQAILNEGYRVEPHRYLKAGKRVRVSRGPFEGLEGIVVRRCNGTRLVVAVESIQRAMAIEVNSFELALVPC